MDLEIVLSRETEGCVVTLRGEVDVYTAPALRNRLVEAVESECGVIIVDMTGVDFIDSSGLGVLVSALKRVREHDAIMRIVCSKESILKIFKITGLDRVFPISATLAEAIKPEE